MNEELRAWFGSVVATIVAGRTPAISQDTLVDLRRVGIVDEERPGEASIYGIWFKVIDVTTQAEFVSCTAVRCFEDDLDGTCAQCGRPIVYRPHVPASVTKLCVPCAYLRVTGRGQG